MKTMISSLVKDSEVEDHFLVTSITKKDSKYGKEYLIIQLADKSGEIDSRFWKVPDDFPIPLENSLVKVRGKVDEYREQLQLQIERIRPSEPHEYDVADFFRCSEREPEEMMSELRLLLIDHMGGGCLQDLVFDILSKNEDAFKRSPAAKSVHHCFLGGLLEHVLSMCKVAVHVCRHYKLRKDLILAAVCLHDIGKTRELSYDQGISYTVEGSLLGHISIGMGMISDAIRDMADFPPRLKVELLHMVASHHGLLEYGSPKVPMMREAIAMHLIDMLDSRMEICKEVLKKKDGNADFTAFSKHLDTFLYKDQA